MPYIGQQPAPKVVTSSDLADDVVTADKIGDTAISGFSALGATPADTDELLVSDAGTLKRVDFSHIKGGGITQANQFRLTAQTNTNTDADITANIEEVDDASFSKIGTGITQSAGIFSFGETGIYLVMLKAQAAVSGADQALVNTFVTQNNSSYVQVAEAHFMGNSSGNFGGFTSSSFVLVDVTDTSNVKVKFTTTSMGSATGISGNTSLNQTTFTFIRLGDT